MREETILHRLRAGDPSGLEALMERYTPYVSAVVWNILRNSMPAEDGEEVVSDVFLAAWRQAGSLGLGSGSRTSSNPETPPCPRASSKPSTR